MRVLLDTHMLLWSADAHPKLPSEAARIIGNLSNNRFFSTASIWEMVIKSASRKKDFNFNPGVLRAKLLDNGYSEIPVTGEHALQVANLPMIHRDPFDRILVAQAQVEGLLLMTTDAKVAQYASAQLFK